MPYKSSTACFSAVYHCRHTLYSPLYWLIECLPISNELNCSREYLFISIFLYSLFWCVVQVFCQSQYNRRSGVVVFTDTGWRHCKTWFIHHMWQRSEANNPCHYSDLLNFSFVLLKYTQCIICLVSFGQHLCRFLEPHGLFHGIYLHPQPSPFYLVSLTNLQLVRSSAWSPTRTPSFHHLAPPYLSVFLHITTFCSFRCSSSIHLTVPISRVSVSTKTLRKCFVVIAIITSC